MLADAAWSPTTLSSRSASRWSALGADRAKDILGRVYEYFLAQFASAEGKKGGQFYTPSRVVRVLVNSSEKFIGAHRGRLSDIAIYGQESNYTTWRLANMNLAIRGIGANIRQGDSFHADADS